MELVRVSVAAKRLGFHPDTIRNWANEGKLPYVRIAGQRRFAVADLDRFIADEQHHLSRREALYVRVSSTVGQETSLLAQEAELRATAKGEVVAVFRDKASGLRENRPGLNRLLTLAGEGKFEVVRVTHEDRLARFGAKWLVALLLKEGIEVQILHPKGVAGGMDELLADFMSLVASFAGRMYGIRGRAARMRLLEQAKEQLKESENDQT